MFDSDFAFKSKYLQSFVSGFLNITQILRHKMIIFIFVSFYVGSNCMREMNNASKHFRKESILEIVKCLYYFYVVIAVD